jgi:hypothetical protein
MATTNGKVSFARATPTAKTAPKPAAPAQAPSPAPTAPTAPVASGGFVVGAGGSTITPLEAGVYHGVLVGIYDLGTQDSTYLGQVSQKRKGVLLWELVGVRISGTDQQTGEAWDRPRTLSKRYTLSMGDKAALRRDVEAVRGKRMTKEEAASFDLSSLLGLNAQLQVTQRTADGKTYSDIQSVMALMKGQAQADAETESAWFHFGAIPEGAVLDATIFPEPMPNWAREKAMLSPEWVALGGQPPATDPMDAVGG